jgi:hypothetical protein
MYNSIKIGDLVMVVKPTTCCGSSNSIGRVFKVLRSENMFSKCNHCGDLKEELHAVQSMQGSWYGYSLTRLIKINPPALDETENEEINLKDYAY